MVKKILECDLFITSSMFLVLLLVLFYVISDIVMEKSFCVLSKVYVVVCGPIVFQSRVLGIFCVDALISVEFFLKEGNQFCRKLFPYGLCSMLATVRA